MSVRVPHPSKRFIRAAQSEWDDLMAHRARLEQDRTRLLDEVRQADEAMADLDDRLRVLDQMVGTRRDANAETGDAPAPESGLASDLPATAEEWHVLSGPAIRETAVRVLLGQPEYIEALHYRRWYELLRQAGYAVAGKDPLAVFLTQITRSPVIRKSTESGVYELDRQAPLCLRQRLERLNDELREVPAPVMPDPSELETARARRHELNMSISQLERALEEALRVLRRDDAEGARAGHPQTASG
jgi:hypothetical protein